MIAIFLTTIGIMALLSLQPTGWKTMAKADYLGRSSGILNRTLGNYETTILNPCCIITVANAVCSNVIVSDNSSAINGDMTYSVCANVTHDTTSTNTVNLWYVTATVTWPPINYIGIQESLIVRRQEMYRFPTGGADNSVSCN